MCAAASPIAWQDARLRVLTGRFVNLFFSSDNLHCVQFESRFSSSQSTACCYSAGNGPLLHLRGQLRQRYRRPPRPLGNERSRQRRDQGHHRSVQCGCRGWDQQVNRSGTCLRSQFSERQQLKYSSFCFCKGGRGVVVGPILSQSRSDVFCDNENGPNFLFKNNGDGTFVDMARQAGENELGC